jgi:hypothetical protein
VGVLRAALKALIAGAIEALAVHPASAFAA